MLFSEIDHFRIKSRMESDHQPMLIILGQRANEIKKSKRMISDWRPSADETYKAKISTHSFDNTNWSIIVEKIKSSTVTKISFPDQANT